MKFGDDKNKDKSFPVLAYYRAMGFQEFESPRFRENRYIKVVRLSTIGTGHLYPTGNSPDTHFCQRLSRPQDNTAAEGIMSMKISNDIIGNRTCFLQACNTVPQNLRHGVPP
jgi:hypothetical protein